MSIIICAPVAAAAVVQARAKLVGDRPTRGRQRRGGTRPHRGNSSGCAAAATATAATPGLELAGALLIVLLLQAGCLAPQPAWGHRARRCICFGASTGVDGTAPLAIEVGYGGAGFYQSNGRRGWRTEHDSRARDQRSGSGWRAYKYAIGYRDVKFTTKKIDEWAWSIQEPLGEELLSPGTREV